MGTHKSSSRVRPHQNPRLYLHYISIQVRSKTPNRTKPSTNNPSYVKPLAKGGASCLNTSIVSCCGLLRGPSIVLVSMALPSKSLPNLGGLGSSPGNGGFSHEYIRMYVCIVLQCSVM